VTQREPDFAVLVQGGAGAHLGARSPARRNARPSGSVAYGGITHECLAFGSRIGPSGLTNLIHGGTFASSVLSSNR
jgi:hypothetical protein